MLARFSELGITMDMWHNPSIGDTEQRDGGQGYFITYQIQTKLKQLLPQLQWMAQEDPANQQKQQQYVAN